MRTLSGFYVLPRGFVLRRICFSNSFEHRAEGFLDSFVSTARAVSLNFSNCVLL
jgi:hypothetical protein